MTQSIVKRLVLCLLVAAVLPLNVSSQTPSTSISPSSSGGQFTLKTATEVVLVNVTVRDKNENFIKDLKRDLAADRLSCSSFRANAFRLQFHAVAYNLLLFFRHHLLRGTELATATLGTLRLRLLKIGARVRASCRKLWFHLSTGWPGRPLFLQVLHRLDQIPVPTG